MLSFLTKFNNLPPELREPVSTAQAMQAISAMEQKYGVNLAILIMKIMVKEIAIGDLEKYFIFENSLSADQARELTAELKQKVFRGVADYLGMTVAGNEKNLNQPLATTKPDVSGRTADFYFSAEDEEEVKAMSQKVTEYKIPVLKTDETEAQEIIKQLNITFSANDLINRFTQVLKTYLKGIRSKIDTRQTLGKQVSFGGLEMSEELIDKVLKLADEIKNRQMPAILIGPTGKIPVLEDVKPSLSAETLKQTSAENRPNTTVAKTANQVKEEKKINVTGLARDIEYDFSQLRSKPAKIPEIQVETKAIDIGHKREIQKDAEKQSSDAFNFTEDSKKEKTAAVNSDEIAARAKRIVEAANIGSSGGISEQPKIAIKGKINSEEFEKAVNVETPITNIVNIRRAKNAGGKIRMDDVKYIPKLMGPIDELREMDAINFRRLDNDADTAANKIREKINFLEDENYRERLKGIRAWRQSPMNRLYLDLGEESIANKKPINVIIDERKASDREYITSAEFNAIMELNKELRY